MSPIKLTLLKVSSHRLATGMDEEEDFHSSYKRHLAIAEECAKKQFYRDAYYELHVAIECILKYAYCLIYHDVQRDPSWAVPNRFYLRVVDRNTLKARTFGHGVRELAQFIEDMTDDAKSNAEFQQLKRNLEPGTDWIEWRYRKVRPYDDKSKQRYNTLLKAFEEALCTCLSGLK